MLVARESLVTELPMERFFVSGAWPRWPMSVMRLYIMISLSFEFEIDFDYERPSL
jgi:hypothetical protein